jgi:prepilin-type processing-associated H-X9-DG protein
MSDRHPVLSLVLTLAGSALIIAALVFVLVPWRFNNRKEWGPPCISNLKQSTISLGMYAADHDDLLPPSAWMDVGKPYVKNDDIHRCPQCPVEGGYGHAMHEAMLGQRVFQARDAATILLFDSTLTQRNALGGLDTLPDPPRHGDKNGIAFADGHVKSVGWR